MATIGSLIVNLSASTVALSTGLSKGQKMLRDFAKQAAALGSTLAALGGAATLTGLASFVHHQMEAIDSTAKLADRLGIGMEAMIGLQHAARLSGVDTEALATALTKMQNTIADAATKGGEAARSLERLGLSAEDLINLRPDEALNKIADSISQIENPALRTQLAMDIFGKAGGKMINVLAGGSASLADAAKEAEQLGLMISRVDAAKIELANDSMTKIGEAVSGLASRFAVELSPYLLKAAEDLLDFVKQGDGLRYFAETTVPLLVRGVGYLVDIVKALSLAWKSVEYALLGVYLAYLNVKDEIQNTNESGRAVVEVENRMKSLGDVISKGFTQTAWFEQLEPWIKAAKERAGELAAAIAKVGQAGAGAKLTSDAVSKADEGKQFIASLENRVALWHRTNEEAQRYLAIQKNLSAADIERAGELGKKLDEQQRIDKLTAKANQFYDSTRTPLEKLHETLKDIDEVVAEGLLDEGAAERARNKVVGDYEESLGKGGKSSDFRQFERGRFKFGAGSTASSDVKVKTGLEGVLGRIEKNTAQAPVAVAG